MKRDLDLARNLLLRLEADQEVNSLCADTEVLLEHLWLLRDAGLIDATVNSHAGRLSGVITHRITWAGHDFLALTRRSGLWELAKTQVIQAGVAWTFGLLLEWLKERARQALP